MKAWAAATRGSPQKVFPSFVASKVFPNNHNLNYSWPSKFMITKSVSTKRFVFDTMAIATLKDQAVIYTSKRRPTRMEVTSALIWKAAAKASLAVKPFRPQTPHALLSYVNLRSRASPPLPYESIENLIHLATGICFLDSQLELPKLVGEIRESIAKINSYHIDSIKGEKGNDVYDGTLNRLKDLMDITEEGDRCLSVTSLLNNGIYKIDFGWGTPIWFYDMNAGFTRIVALNDTLKRGGVEATVTLTSNEMEVFETDNELLSYATINSSPLEFLND
ncbi:17,18-epoxy-17-hydroxycur-19-ene N-malonyltransferase-like [Bidens hawaiensis]|uniref:17,18-epoxy-17-hydroxycur-19-ene N-malonyltransferase-like n=1 Tax=Bidens hawaiensis TaxID=980011 RepID=UPI0040499C88